MAMTTIARARGGDAVVSIATSSRRRCRRWSVSTRARRGFLAEKLRDEGAGEDEGDARAIERGARTRVHAAAALGQLACACSSEDGGGAPSASGGASSASGGGTSSNHAAVTMVEMGALPLLRLLHTR